MAYTIQTEDVTWTVTWTAAPQNKKRAPAKAKAAAPELIFDDQSNLALPVPPRIAKGWADEIAHEVATAEKAFDDAYRDAHGEIFSGTRS